MQSQLQARSNRFLTFRVGGQLYALNSAEVLEVIRVPAVARVPQGPSALLGLANLRGAVLPVASLHQMLGKASAPDTSTSRAIVLDSGAPVAVVVDSVAALEHATDEQVDTRPKEVGAAGGERLLGAFPAGPEKQVAKILDIRAMLADAFAHRARAEPRNRAVRAAAHTATEPSLEEEKEALVTFEVAGQEFALPVAEVEEILPAPAIVSAVAHSDSTVLGLASVRDALLPLLSLRVLLGLSSGERRIEREKVLVVKVGGTRVGLVADHAREIVAADSRLIEGIPPALAARTSGESRIRAVYRGAGGRRLISILSTSQLFREDVMQKLMAGQRPRSERDQSGGAAPREELIFLVFRLGEDEFGLPIDAVVEVAPVPGQITRIPKTPKFLEGVVNLRGEVLPVVDQRRRFDMPPTESLAGRRLIVIKTERHRAGVIVDGVTDVLRSPADAIEPAPRLTDETSRLVRGVINLTASGRMVLLLDPMELLTRTERGLLEKFEAERQRKDA